MDKPCRARSYHADRIRLVASSGFIDPSKPRVTILASMGNVVSFGLIIPSRRAPLPPFICSLTSFRDLDAGAANVCFLPKADIGRVSPKRGEDAAAAFALRSKGSERRNRGDHFLRGHNGASVVRDID